MSRTHGAAGSTWDNPTTCTPCSLAPTVIHVRQVHHPVSLQSRSMSVNTADRPRDRGWKGVDERPISFVLVMNGRQFTHGVASADRAAFALTPPHTRYSSKIKTNAVNVMVIIKILI